jgi:hypothetical protein
VWKRRSWALFVHLSRIYRGASPRRLTCTDFPVNDLGGGTQVGGDLDGRLAGP